MDLHAWKQRAWSAVPRPLRRPVAVTIQAVNVWADEQGPQLGASIAFYSMFALAPLLVIVITIAGAVFGEEAARGQIVGQIQELVGLDAARSIEAMIASSWRSDNSGLAGLLGVAALLVGASGVFVALRNALNRLGRLTEQPTGLGAFVRARLVAFALVLGFGFLSIVSLIASAALAALGAYLSQRFPPLGGVIAALDVTVSTIVLSFAFAALLRWLPESPPAWPAAWRGALVSALLFAVGKHLIGLYLGRASVSSSYGAAGSFVVLMLWVYYASQILLLGAALAWCLNGARGVPPTAPS
ncbi:YihY/virulence factor BrkB family protein [Aquabacterium sp. A7-Y]|uniref:YihY/virulence factor BrkB family protein n=1 Tax=Aquabacterium sp. A7-Y TaxID=1349605 RepID=UPI00223CCB76|nr:YihY/virulence factor BrkB family protein [Aquabacterium sp. A7-Y]MCW7536370.1 YihY/virulence factor BrkB family protein [Aquabacterium sp. A7-Y]